MSAEGSNKGGLDTFIRAVKLVSKIMAFTSIALSIVIKVRQLAGWDKKDDDKAGGR